MLQNASVSEENLSDKQLQAIPLLISSKSVSEAAELAGVHRTTINRWLRDETFRAAYEEQRDAIAFYARSGMRALMLKAVAIQAGRLDSDDPVERARVAKEIIDYDTRTSTNHENQKLVYRLHNLIYSVENPPQDERFINAEVDDFITSQERL